MAAANARLQGASARGVFPAGRRTAPEEPLGGTRRREGGLLCPLGAGEQPRRWRGVPHQAQRLPPRHCIHAAPTAIPRARMLRVTATSPLPALSRPLMLSPIRPNRGSRRYCRHAQHDMMLITPGTPLSRRQVVQSQTRSRRGGTATLHARTSPCLAGCCDRSRLGNWTSGNDTRPVSVPLTNPSPAPRGTAAAPTSGSREQRHGAALPCQ